MKHTVDLNTLLTDTQFADAFRIEIADRTLDARQATERMLTRQPRWIEVLLTLRNLLVTPFGPAAPDWHLNRARPLTSVDPPFGVNLFLRACD